MLLLVIVWGWSPITGALVVSGLPVGAVLVRKLTPVLPSRVAAAAGGVALAGGLVALAFLPSATAAWAAPALFACGLGLGLLGAVLGPASVPPTEANVRAATISIAARHAGFVLALAVIAPVLASQIDSATLEATRATTAEILDADIALRTKVDLALDLRDLVADAPRGEVPDPSVPFDERGAADDANLRDARDGVVESIRDTLDARLPSVVPHRRLVRRARRAGRRDCFPCCVRCRATSTRSASPAAIIVLVVVLIAAEFRAGARDFGTREYVAPCDAPEDPFPQGDGIDGTLQRIALSAINGAACDLHTGREELILSLEPRSGFGPEVTWTQDTLEEALRAGLIRAIDDADERNTLPGLAARALKVVADHAPIDWILGRFDIPFLED